MAGVAKRFRIEECGTGRVIWQNLPALNGGITGSEVKVIGKKPETLEIGETTVLEYKLIGRCAQYVLRRTDDEVSNKKEPAQARDPGDPNADIPVKPQAEVLPFEPPTKAKRQRTRVNAINRAASRMPADGNVLAGRDPEGEVS
jgi:hypothetical protein